MSQIAKPLILCCLAGIIGGVSACGDASDPVRPIDDPQQAIQADRFAMIRAAARNPNDKEGSLPLFEEDLIAVSEAVSAFGGIFVDGEAFVIQTTDDSSSSREALLNALRDRNLLPTNDLNVEFRRVDFSWADLAYWRAIFLTLHLSSDVYLLDLDERRNRILVGTRSDAAAGRVKNEFLAVGVPGEALEFAIVSEVADDSALTDYVTAPRAGYQILVNAGVPGGAEDLRQCTLGANATDLSLGTWFFLSAAHCTRRIGIVDHDVTYQPGAFYPAIGREAHDEPWQTCFQFSKCKTVDVSVFEYTARSPDLRIARAALGSPQLLSPASWEQAYFATTRPPVGTAVELVGRSSGRTAGTIHQSCVIISANGGFYQCVDYATYTSAVGDSGGPVFMATGGSTERAVIGIHKGSQQISGVTYAVVSPSENVRSAYWYMMPYLTWCYSQSPGC